MLSNTPGCFLRYEGRRIGNWHSSYRGVLIPVLHHGAIASRPAVLRSAQECRQAVEKEVEDTQELGFTYKSRVGGRSHPEKIVEKECDDMKKQPPKISDS